MIRRSRCIFRRLIPLPSPLPKAERVTKHSTKTQEPPRDHNRSPADANFFNLARLALHFQTNAAGAIDKISLLDHKSISAIDWIDVRGAMLNQITSERSRRAACGRVFTNVHSDKKSRVRAGLADFERLARERVATRPVQSSQNLATRKDFVEQRLVYPAMT